jgi:hypothetical protein
MEIIKKLENMDENDVIIEFDFRSFFNKIARDQITLATQKYSILLTNSVKMIMDKIRYTFKTLRPEAELIKPSDLGDLKWIYRSGVPQGLALSPLVATLALENKEIPEGIVMYADDGIFIGKEHTFREFLYNSIEAGAEIALEKTMKITQPEFKFLGVMINRKNKTVGHNDYIIP